mmetsp:Transcript_74160/g.130933  ORF Transcript_74160/g.130933 Transcript_74160/m.130933 type:complete len:238 (-) Transcript_74160:832-1545(-)
MNPSSFGSSVAMAEGDSVSGVFGRVCNNDSSEDGRAACRSIVTRVKSSSCLCSHKKMCSRSSTSVFVCKASVLKTLIRKAVSLHDSSNPCHSLTKVFKLHCCRVAQFLVSSHSWANEWRISMGMLSSSKTFLNGWSAMLRPSSSVPVELWNCCRALLESCKYCNCDCNKRCQPCSSVIFTVSLDIVSSKSLKDDFKLRSRSIVDLMVADKSSSVVLYCVGSSLSLKDCKWQAMSRKL